MGALTNITQNMYVLANVITGEPKIYHLKNCNILERKQNKIRKIQKKNKSFKNKYDTMS